MLRCFEEVQDQTRQILQGALDYSADGATVKALEEEPDKPRSVVYVRAHPTTPPCDTLPCITLSPT